MERTSPRIALLALASFSLASACSSRQEPALPLTEDNVFSDADKRAARALSVSNNEAVTDAASPYARALLCKLGIDTIAARFQNAQGPMLAEQGQAIEQARAYFDANLRLLAEREGKSEAELKSDMEETAWQHPEPAENAQIAITCLRRLQEAT